MNEQEFVKAEREGIVIYREHLSRKAGTAPSLRIPVTATNRSFLRWLRAAEMSAWEKGDGELDAAEKNSSHND